MKKLSIVILFVLPIVVFTLVSVSGIIVNNTKYTEVETVEILSDQIIEAPAGEKHIFVKEPCFIQLGYRILPEDATEKTVTWEIVSGQEYATVNQFGVVHLKAPGDIVVVKLYDSNRIATDIVKIHIRVPEE